MIDINKHRAVLVQILKDIYADMELSSLLGFKGGTACYLFYDLPRFSVDLDFDLLDPGKGNQVFNKVRKTVEEYGEVKDQRNKRFTLFFLLSYGRGKRNVKVEISKRKSLSSYGVKNYLGISVLVMQKEDMFAHKLVALTKRKGIANRDLFDIWFFMKNQWGINEKIIKARTGKGAKEYLKKCISQVKKVDEKYILQGLGEMVGEEQKHWIRKNLKKELLFLMNLYLKQVEEFNSHSK